MISRAERNTLLQGVSVTQSAPMVSHLFFADDNLIFIRADVNGCMLLKDILEAYETTSSQLVNFEKSTLSFSSNTSQRIRERIFKQFSILRWFLVMKNIWGYLLLSVQTKESFLRL